ncbi:MAG: D-alanine--D-alanine ligase family protein [Bacillota bacterium]|nr:D-alanine--D-alanine ligase family protein [Bacillota bacterium]
MAKINLLVLFGGVSTEHEVSRVSAASVLSRLDPEKYNIIPVGITKAGQWFLYGGCDSDAVSEGRWETAEENLPAILSPSRGDGLLVFGKGKVAKIPVDCVFPVLHGLNGEDGTLQGLFEAAGVAYVGSGVGASSNCMDKSVTKILAGQYNILQADYILVHKSEFAKAPDDAVTAAEEKFKYPVFVKPSSSGSSVGVSKAKDREGLKSALDEAFRYDKKVLIEEAVDGQEIEVAVLGNDEPIASVPGEIVPSREFYSYEAKYIDNSSGLIIPAGIPEEASDSARKEALTVYRALGCRGLARVDFFVRRADFAVVLNEINTIPGFTSISMYPKLFEASGIKYPELLDRLIALAMSDK